MGKVKAPGKYTQADMPLTPTNAIRKLGDQRTWAAPRFPTFKLGTLGPVAPGNRNQNDYVAGFGSHRSDGKNLAWHCHGYGLEFSMPHSRHGAGLEFNLQGSAHGPTNRFVVRVKTDAKHHCQPEF